VEAIVRRSERSPLYLRMLCEDLAEHRLPFGEIERLPRGVVAYFERIIKSVEDEGRERDPPDPALRALEKTYAEEATLAPEVTSFLERARARLASEAGVRSIELLALYCMVLEPVSLRDALEMLMLAGARDARHEVHRAYEVIRTVLVDVGNGRFTVFHGAFR